MRLMTCALLLSLATVAAADTPKPQPQLEAIRGLIGNWTGKGSMTTEGKTFPVTMTFDCVESSGAAGVRCKAAILGIPNFTYQFDDLWGYSPQDGLTHWYTVTNAGEVHDHRGHFDANGGMLQTEIPVEGKLFSEIVTFKRKGKTMAMSWVVTVGGTVHDRGELAMQLKGK